MQDWIAVLQQFGLPTLALIAIAIFFWKAVWPIMVRRSEFAEKLLMENVSRAYSRNDKIVEDFLIALDRRDKIHAETVNELRVISSALMDLKRK